mmetsp:Transcript_32279/g.111613  ORF Transcript_32279/g.111613 Transcript_32279/m.111613 type:complete len:232 (-) Transcript_32279:567-1262(-)
MCIASQAVGGRSGSEAVVEVGHVAVVGNGGELGVLFVGDVEGASADAPRRVERELVVDKANVQRALVRVEARVLHGQDPGRLVGLVVVRVPPAGRREEDGAVDPVALDGVDDVAVLVNLAAHQSVDLARRQRRRDGEVQRDGVVAVRPLDRLGPDGVQERPQNVRQRHRRLLRGHVAEEHAEAVAVLSARRVADLLDVGQEAGARKVRRLKFLHIRRDSEVRHQRLVVDPI